jgi:hypothetical protein
MTFLKSSRKLPGLYLVQTSKSFPIHQSSFHLTPCCPRIEGAGTYVTQQNDHTKSHSRSFCSDCDGGLYFLIHELCDDVQRVRTAVLHLKAHGEVLIRARQSGDYR